MFRRFARLVALSSALALAGCDEPTAPGPVSTPSAQHSTASFVFHYPPTLSSGIAALATDVEAQSRRVVTELGAAGMRPVQVRFYGTHAEMADAVRPVAGAIPAWATGLVTAADEIHLLAPSAVDSRLATLVVHEFAHCASLHLNPAIANNPRWLWEAVAVYEARQAVDPRTLPYLASGLPPLSELNSFEHTRIYDLGYTLGEFIVHRGGLDALRRLITSRGDTAAAMGLDIPAFERAWREFVDGRYPR